MSPKHAIPKSGTDKKLQAKIAELQDKKHLPEQMVALVTTVTKLQNAHLPKVAFIREQDHLPDEILQRLSSPEKRLSGLPILPGKEFPLDLESVKELSAALLEAIPSAVPTVADLTQDLRKLLDDNPTILDAAVREILNPELYGKETPCLDSWAKDHPASPHFFRFVLTSAAMPSLVTAGRILGKEYEQEKVWQHGHCPVCGNQPLIGRLEGKEGRRLHTCSFCAFEYRVPRMGCPFCLSPETEGSEYYISEDEPGYLLTVCDSCKNYFKLGDFREFDRPWLPLLDDLGSLTLDLYALQMDYKRPTLSGWGF